MKYIKKFDSHTDYNTYITNTKNLPNVSLCRNDNEEHVHFNPKDYSKEYLTTVARENGTISFNIHKSMGTDMITSISYSTDDGETWTTTANQDNKEEHLVIDVNVNTGNKVLWKGIANQLGYNDEDDYGDYVGSFFSSDCEFDTKGNVMSLLYGDNFKGQTTIEENGAFCCLFHDYDGEKSCSIVNAKDMSLPATTLTNACYYYMFQNCTSLVNAPQLNATTLASDCYSGMFQGCTSLTNAPELSATTLAFGCYNGMFRHCTLLVNAPSILLATTLHDYCYRSMFEGCTSLTTAPELPATTLEANCYQSMFEGCTSLTTAPELPATTLAQNCYKDMFKRCTALTTAPELPSTTLVSYCYSDMFSYCTSLVTAPELPATTLVSNCYYYMFNGCTSLNYIKAMFTTTPSSGYTNNWVQNVAATGTFVKNSAAQWDVTGVHGIPSGWTVQTASE